MNFNGIGVQMIIQMIILYLQINNNGYLLNNYNNHFYFNLKRSYYPLDVQKKLEGTSIKMYVLKLKLF